MIAILCSAALLAAPAVDSVLTTDLALERTRYQALGISPDGARAVAVSEQTRGPDREILLRLFDLRPEAPDAARTLDLPSGRYGYFRFSADGRTVAFLRWSSSLTEVWLLDTVSARLRRFLSRTETHRVFDLAFVPVHAGQHSRSVPKHTEELLLLRHAEETVDGPGINVARADFLSDTIVQENNWLRGHPLEEASVSADGHWLAAVVRVGPLRGPEGGARDVHLLDLQTGRSRRITRADGIATRPVFSPDVRQLAYLWTPDSTLISPLHREIRVAEVSHGSADPWSAPFPLSVGNGIFGAEEELWYSSSGELFTATQCGLSDRVLVVNVRRKRWRWRTPADHSYRRLAVADRIPRALAVQTGPSTPDRLVSLDLTDGAAQVLDDPNRALGGLLLGVAERVQFRGSDDLPMEGLLLRPRGQDRSYPLIVMLHGGSSGRHTLQFNEAFSQVFVGLGYAVLLPNTRGSAGYSSEFSQANLGDFGGLEVEDVLRATDAAVASGFVDDDRIFVTGHSYGGYLANMSVVRSDRFRAAASLAAVSDWELFYQTSDLYGLATLGLGGTPDDSRDLYLERSPLNQVDAIDTPMLLLHGLQDRRVPPEQSRRFYRALVERGVDSHLVEFDQGHIFRDPASIRRWINSVHQWFFQHGAPRPE